MNGLKYGQDFGLSGTAGAGFNRRIQGDSYADCFQYPHERQDRDMNYGFNKADSLINAGKIPYIHNFHHSHGGCSGYAFQYGGYWVCKTCSQRGVDKPWWVIQVVKDGDQFMCHGPDFADLQASSNYAFGGTKEAAIQAYGDLMKGQA